MTTPSYMYVSLDTFNAIFNAQLEHLPNSMCGFGRYHDDFIIHTEGCYLMNCFTFLQYWVDSIHIKLPCKSYYFIFCFYDGYDELMEYSSPLRIHHKNKDILCFSKRKDHPYTICVPDAPFIQSVGYKERLQTIDTIQLPYDKKNNKCIFRGNIAHGRVTNFKYPCDKQNLNQRQYIKSLYNEKKLHECIDLEDDNMPIHDQVQYKYQLLIDGWCTPWDSWIWKLYTDSVLLATDSIWEQWYHKDLIPWVHFIPINNDFSNLNEMLVWCIAHDDQCREIAMNGKKFVVDNLMFEKVTDDFCDSMVFKFIENN